MLSHSRVKKEEREIENAVKQKKREQKEREKDRKEKVRQALVERDNLYLEKLSSIAAGSFWGTDSIGTPDGRVPGEQLDTMSLVDENDMASLTENGEAAASHNYDNFPKDIVDRTIEIMTVSSARPTVGGKKPWKEHRQHTTTPNNPSRSKARSPKCLKCVQLEE